MTLGSEQRNDARQVLAHWKGPWPYQVTMAMLFFHSLTGGRHWEMVGLRQGPLDAQNMGFAGSLRCLFDGGPAP